MLGEYSAAESLNKEAIDIYEKLEDDVSPDYVTSLSNLATLYRTMGNLNAAEPLYVKVKTIYEEKCGKEHLLYARSCNGLGVFYLEAENYDLAESLLIEAKNIREKLLGKDNEDYANSCSNLAALYQTVGDYKAAEELHLEGKAIRAKVLGTKHRDYAESCNNLGQLYKEIGNFASGEPLLIETLEILKSTSGEKNMDYAAGCQNLASFYRAMHNYPAAESYYIKAKDIAEQSVGKEIFMYATITMGLASLYHDIGKFDISESLCLEAAKIIEKMLGKNNVSYAVAIGNLASFYRDKGDYKTSEAFYLEAQNIYKIKLGNQNPHLATNYSNLGYMYGAMGNYAASDSLYTQALQIREKQLGKLHPSYIGNCFSLAYVNHLSKNNLLAEKYFTEAMSLATKTMLRNFSFMSEREKELYIQTESKFFHNFYSFCMDRKMENPEIISDTYNHAIQLKGLLLKSSTALRSAILSSKDSSLIAMYKKWISLKKEISTQYSIEISKRKKNPEELENQANTLEKDLVRQSQLFSDFEKMQSITWESVKKNLKPDEVAFEFIHFAQTGKKDTVLYAALIVKPDSQYPEMVSLFVEKDLENILGKFTTNNLGYVNSIYGTNSEVNTQLYHLIWQPMEEYLGQAKTIYLSPSGLLHKVSFAAIAKSENVYLCDEYRLNIQSSTAKVALTEHFAIGKDSSATVIGGINYNTDQIVEEVWSYLEGTKYEAEKIKTLLSKKKINTTIFVGNESTEEKLKNSSGKSNILHIATHGFFFPDPQEELLALAKGMEVGEVSFRGGRRTRGFGVWGFVRNPNPLMRSGLTFAGANQIWTDKYVSSDHDGVLTAEEVINLNMRKTDLVVLSACETGLGDIKGSEGVYGLQRAFKMAGAKFIVMSLWQVPDRETVEFMETFYAKLLKQNDIRKSFTETQKEMRQKYDPYFWAAFVLVE